MDLERDELFREAMAHLASGVAVITTRRPDGLPCGIAATALVCAFAILLQIVAGLILPRCFA